MSGAILSPAGSDNVIMGCGSGPETRSDMRCRRRYRSHGVRDSGAPALAAGREAKGLALRQGLSRIAANTDACNLELMFELGSWDELLAIATKLRLDAGLGAVFVAFMEPFRAAIHCWRGALAEAHRYLDPVLETGRDMPLGVRLPALSAALSLNVAEGNADQALHILGEYEQALPLSTPANGYHGGKYLADIVRGCVALGEIDHAQRLVGAVEPALWRHRLQVLSSRAVLAEAAGDPAAEELYSQATTGWQEYGHVLERGLALLGAGRCRRRAGRPDASVPLLAARDIFAGLGAVAPVAEADSRLGDSMRHTS